MAWDGSIKRRNRRADAPFPAADDPEMLDPILDELGADDDVRVLARELAAQAESTMWIIGKRRSTVAASTVYAAGVLAGDSSPVFKQSEVAAASAVSPGSIVSHYPDLLDLHRVAASTD